ncbi:5,6-dimethylbenzimidazole synthase [Haloarculaceae archaeon H-GB2-1]|nr:5,6-dimethylbenzimidazole synthase [Haloarculaceae archaeon H-GB2-1]
MVDFTREEREAVYRAIYARRDIRRFRPDPVPDDVVERLIDAAHHAPSVGFSQPWDIVVVDDEETKLEIKDIASRAIAAAQQGYTERKEDFGKLKLEGIEESPLNVCITCDPTRGAPHVLGRNTMREMDVYSTCLAVQNLWLAARAEGSASGGSRSCTPTRSGRCWTSRITSSPWRISASAIPRADSPRSRSSSRRAGASASTSRNSFTTAAGTRRKNPTEASRLPRIE